MTSTPVSKINVLMMIGLTLLSYPALANPKMPRGAFLLHPAPNARALSQQVMTDRTVLARYVALFQLPPQSIKRAFAHLRLITLAKDGVYKVHYVHPGEEIGYRLRRVRKGTRVYATADGTPIVAQVCGNPLRSGLDVALKNTGVAAGRLSGIPEFVPDEPRLAQASDFTPTASVNRGAEPSKNMDAPAETVSAVVEAPMPLSPIPVAVAGASLEDWAKGVGAAGALAGLAAGLQGGSGGSSNGAGGTEDTSGGGTGTDSGGGNGSLTTGGDGGGTNESGQTDGNGGIGSGSVPMAPEPDLFTYLFSLGTLTGLFARTRLRKRP